MASILLNVAGAALLGPVGGAIGAVIGTVIDARLSAALTPEQRVEGARLEDWSAPWKVVLPEVGFSAFGGCQECRRGSTSPKRSWRS